MEGNETHQTPVTLRAPPHVGYGTGECAKLYPLGTNTIFFQPSLNAFYLPIKIYSAVLKSDTKTTLLYSYVTSFPCGPCT